MPKCDEHKKASESIQNQILQHSPEVLAYIESDTKTCDFQAQALALARHGLHVHPLKSGDKAPMLKGWQGKASSNSGAKSTPLPTSASSPAPQAA